MLTSEQFKYLEAIAEAGKLGRIYSEEAKDSLDILEKAGLIDMEAQKEFPFYGKPRWSLTTFITPKGQQYINDQKTKNRRNPDNSLITIAIKHPDLSLNTMKIISSAYNQKFEEIIGDTFELRTFSSDPSGYILLAVDEFGKDKNLPYNFLWAEYGDPIHGPAIFVKETTHDQFVSLTARELAHLRGVTKI